MSVAAPAIADEKSLAAEVAAETEIRNLVAQTAVDAERIRSPLAGYITNSDDELGKLISELQELRECLKSEAERLQREFANYENMQQNVSAAANIINQTIGPWKSSIGETQSSRTKPLVFGSHGKVKRWPFS
jgi:DNA repair exonuclease SbcCD ATPase subunit